MSRRVRMRAVAGGALAGAVVLAVSGCGASAGKDRHPEHRSFAVRGHTLTVDSDDSGLEIVGGRGEGRNVAVTRWFDGSVLVGGKPRVSWAFKDDRLVLRMHCSGLVADCSARYRVEVPAGIGVRVVDGNGDVRARGFADPLAVRTANGGVRITDTTGPLDLSSGNGPVHADVASTRVRARVDNGSVDLRLSRVPDSVDTGSDNGSLTVVLPRAAYHVKATSHNGGVHVSVPRDSASAHRVTAGSANGKVTVRTAN
ncbi:DUF4097 family beta strand repeat protein [Streptomyces sp. NEAU-sy36]|uniref:DUF4097 family beta strand repeat-containing protein n=1 Tax=unclassified Streptomyces TaxID=2593676 RepID=UPI0015D5F27C|nr:MULTISPECIES: DUF4097 family beta strand repeat-containing protein [unclassified Streptomyces]QLJ00634.1 DUF4097 family beta strand repeat protein [Streptomyces sp. NEAU-sy36]